MELNIMIEGQDGLSWPHWQRLVTSAEDLGFDGLYRSDHFVNSDGVYRDNVETWISLAWAASHTQRLHVGTNVSPISFRNPAILAWQANSIAALSGGRLHLGVGAGWNSREHEAFGFDLLDLDERFARFEEGVQVVRSLTRSGEPATFDGSYYRLDGALMQPRSPQSDGVPITIGGNGPKRTLPLVARYADEWNGMYLSPEGFRERSMQLDELIVAAGRQPSSVKRTLMIPTKIAPDEQELERKLVPEDATRISDNGGAIGTPSQIIDILAQHREAGVDGVMLQWHDMNDISGMELFARDVLPQIRRMA